MAKGTIEDLKMEWQPIETAPKDGTTILFWDDLMDYQIGSWSEYEDPDGEPREGWNDGIFPIIGDSGQPSHWMPLPQPPQPPAARV